MPRPLPILFALALITPAFAQTRVQGPVVETYGGVSGNGIQTVILLTADGEVLLRYAKPDFHPKFTRKICHEIGAIWTVTADLTPPTQARLAGKWDGNLLTASCNGAVDPRIYEPQRTVRLYLDHLASFRRKEAAQLVTPRLRTSGSHFLWDEDRITDMSAKDLRKLIVASWYFSSRPVQGSSLYTIVTTLPDADIQINSERRKLIFGLKRPSQSAPWLIDEFELEYE